MGTEGGRDGDKKDKEIIESLCKGFSGEKLGVVGIYVLHHGLKSQRLNPCVRS
jgi:hypothetical protein